MPLKIIEAENRFNNLLPTDRPEYGLPPGLMAAAQAWSDTVWEKAEALGPMPLDEDTLIDGRNLAAHPVFIFGVHRSGTTLLRNLLDGHPDMVALPSEGTYYTNLESKLLSLPEGERSFVLCKEWLRRLANPINQPPYWLLGCSSDTTLPYVDFARYFMAWWGVLKQKKNTQWPHTAIVLAYACCTGNIKAKLWVDKTPVNERFIERIWKEMPQAKIIHIVRAPADILASRKKMEPSVPLRDILRDMRLSFNIAHKYAHDPRFMLLRYEELCIEPGMTINNITSFLEVRNSPVLSQATVAGIPTNSNSSFKNSIGAAGEILKANPRPHNDILTRDEQQLVAAYMSGPAQKLNYPLVKIGILRKYYLKIKYGLL